MKEMMLEHFEKGILAVCLGVMAWFVSSGMGVKPYEKKPEDFTSVTAKARKLVAESKPNEEQLNKDLAIANFGNTRDELTKNVDSKDYNFQQELVRVYNFAGTFREQPKILVPRKPAVQSNRGLLALYEVDEKGERKTQKIKLSELTKLQKQARRGGKGEENESIKMARENFKKAAKNLGKRGRGMGSMNMMEQMSRRGGRGGDSGMSSAQYSQEMMRGMSDQMADSGMMDGMGGMGMGADYSREMSMSMYSGNESMMETMFGEEVATEVDLGNTTAEVENRKTARKRRIVFSREDLKAKDDTTKKDSKKKEDEEIEVYKERVSGEHWVEIVSVYPHSDQIREYVKALKEPYMSVFLRYAMAEVQRREVASDGEWTSWEPIELKKQFDVVQNAISFEPEDFPSVIMKGLAMNIPFNWTTEKPTLLLPEFENPEKVTEWPYEMRDPVGAEMRKRGPQLKQRSRVRPKTPIKSPAVAKASQTQTFNKQPSRVKLGFEDVRVGKKEGYNNGFQVKHAMVRFWDFTVIPGHKYQYRVRVSVYNPNYGRQDVAASEYATKILLEGDWCEPSDPILVESDLRWYANEPARTRPDTVELEVQSWVKEMGEWITHKFTHRVGDTIGTFESPDEKIKVVEWNDQLKDWLLEEKPMPKTFQTDSVILAISGGRVNDLDNEDTDWRKQFTIPRAVVAVNEYGDLVRHMTNIDAEDNVREIIAKGYNELIDTLEEKTEKVTAKMEGDDEEVTSRRDPTRRDPTKRDAKKVDPKKMDAKRNENR